MMKKTIALTLLCSCNDLCAASMYTGVDYVRSRINIGGSKTNPTMTNLRLGWHYSRQIALEAQYGKSSKADSLFRFDVDLEATQGLYARLISREYSGVTMDVTLGYARSVLTVNGPVGTFNGTDSYEGFSWGIAAYQRLESYPNANFRIAYQSLYDDGDLKISGLSLGFTYHF